MILTPDQRLRVFVSSTLGELAAERAAVRRAIESLRLAPVMFEMGARPHPPRALYRAYLEQSQVFLAIYANRYGWTAPGMELSGLEDEYRASGDRPKLVYVLDPAPDRDEALTAMLRDVASDPQVRLRRWSTVDQLAAMVGDDLAALLAEPFTPPSATGTASVPTRAAPGDTGATVALPVPTTSIVGREGEVVAVSELLRRPDVRMVTITGLGGVGKSRLALEVGSRVQGEFPGGVVFVSLSEVPEPGLVVTSIASRLGVRLDASRPSIEAVADALADRGDLLVVLDNAEHVRDAADDLAALIGTCPALTLLVTSRSRVRLVAEYDYPLTPLGVGGGHQVAGFGVTGADPQSSQRVAERSPAVQLFLERAAASRPDLDLAADPVQRRAVVALCQRLDGLPLAIEVAAARTRLLPPTVLLERLAGRLDLPAARLADLPARQRTLRATIDWSHDLLEPAERDLLAQLGTFSGGASLDAIEAVVEIEGDLLDLLASLADHSLLEVDATVIDAPRFTMLEVVREYARERLDEAGRTSVVDRAHRAWVRGLADRARAELPGPLHAQWLERLELEAANIRLAGTRADLDGDPETLVHLGYCFWLWLWARHHTLEARGWLERVLDHADQLTPLTRARLVWMFAGFGVEQGDNELAFRMLAEATERFTALDDDEGLALCDFLDASLAPLQEEYDRAVDTFGRAEQRLVGLGDYFVSSICASTTGMILAQQGKFDQAAPHLDRGLDYAERIDNAMLRGSGYVSRGFSQLGRGRLDEAAADFAAGARWAYRCQNPESLSFACDGLAAVALARGAAGVQAAVLVGAASGLRHRVGVVPWPGLRPVMAAIAQGVEAALDPAAFAEGYERGRHLDTDAIRDLTVQVSTEQVPAAEHTAAPAAGADGAHGAS
jgi:predicted ATPase